MSSWPLLSLNGRWHQDGLVFVSTSQASASALDLSLSSGAMLVEHGTMSLALRRLNKPASQPVSQPALRPAGRSADRQATNEVCCRWWKMHINYHSSPFHDTENEKQSSLFRSGGTLVVLFCHNLVNINFLCQKEFSILYYTSGSLISLLTHTVAHFNRLSFRPKTNNQPIKKFLSLAVSWVKVVKNCKNSETAKSKMIQMFLKLFHWRISLYYCSTFFGIDIFWKLLNHFIF